MQARVPPEQYPWWVKFSMIGARSQASHWIWFWLSLIVGVVLLIFEFTNPDGLDIFFVVVGAVSLANALLYGLTIRWIDRHGTWG